MTDRTDRARPPVTDPAALIAFAKADPEMVRDFGKPGAAELSEGELASALGYRGPGGRLTVRRIVEGGGIVTARMLLLALLDGWRPGEPVL